MKDKRILFRACTVYQLINAINVRVQMLEKDTYADIILSASTDFSVFGENMKKVAIFDNIIYSDDTTHTNRTLRALNSDEKKTIFDYPEKYFELIHVNGEQMEFSDFFREKYTDFYISVDDEYSMLIYYYMLQCGIHMNIHIFDESKATYVLDIPKRYGAVGFPHDKFGDNQYIKNIKEIILYEPELNLAPEFGPKITKLPKIDVKNLEICNIYKTIFGYNDVPEEQFIYFEGPFFWDEFVMNDLDVLEEFANIVGKENIIVKMHPRDKIDRYTCRGYKVMENSIIPWEITTMLCDLSQKVLVTITSNAVMTGDFVFNKRNKIIQLDKMLSIGQQAEALKRFDMFDKKFMEYFNGIEQHYYRPESLDEVKEIIIYLKGVIRSNV